MASDDRWRIVLIDDEPDIREVVSIALQDAGYDVSAAADGEKGLALCASLRPQIVVTDIRMPKMDGLEVLAAVKEMDPDIEVIVVTAFAEMDLAIRALQLDASDFVTKPVHDDALQMALRRARQRHRTRRQLKELNDLKIRALEQEVEDQARILHQDKMMSLGRLAASVVHEINNPLSGILNYLRLMSRVMERGPIDPRRQEQFREYLELVCSETARCSRIVSGLLAFSRKSPPEFGTVRLDEVMERCVALSRHKLELQHIALEQRIAEGLPSVRGDGNQIQQAVINLIFNAVDAMPEGGRLALRAETENGKDTVRIEVTDTGHGIDEADLPRIFEPFFTRKQEGAGVGLGLSTVYGIMERHGGRVEVQSRKGSGTTFSLYFPVGDAPRESEDG